MDSWPVWGVDVSKHQAPHRCNWETAAAAGLSFSYVKMSEGRDHSDISCTSHLTRLYGAGVIVGVYHFARLDLRFFDARGRAGGVLEAEFAADMLMRTVGHRAVLPLALDLEKYTDKAATSADRGAYVEGFVDRFEELLGRLPLIYTGEDYWRFQQPRSLAAELRDRGVLLWQVDYTAKPDPTEHIPGWPWAIWQWSGGGRANKAKTRIPGLPSPIDRNRYRGSEREFSALLRGVPQ